MEKHEDIARTFRSRLAELKGHVAEIDRELRQPLSADSEEQATDLEGQDALQGLENSKLVEIRQIEQALKRIEDGAYGVCVGCGEPIGLKRLQALPTSTSCISCAK